MFTQSSVMQNELQVCAANPEPNQKHNSGSSSHKAVK
jgi:hypothetical protein